jgi:hypothetical protein
VGVGIEMINIEPGNYSIDSFLSPASLDFLTKFETPKNLDEKIKDTRNEIRKIRKILKGVPKKMVKHMMNMAKAIENRPYTSNKKRRNKNYNDYESLINTLVKSSTLGWKTLLYWNEHYEQLKECKDDLRDYLKLRRMEKEDEMWKKDFDRRLDYMLDSI